MTDLGGMLLLMGDSHVRGQFCHLDDWLRRELQLGSLPPYALAIPAGNSSWDGLACGFNGAASTSFACQIGISAFPEDLAAEVLTRPTPCRVGRREFALPLTDVGRVAAAGYVESHGVRDLLAQVQRLASSGFSTLSGTAVSAVALHSCLHDLRDRSLSPASLASTWDAIGDALRGFEGTVVLLTCPAKHNIGDVPVILGPFYRSIHEALYRLEAQRRGAARARWHVLDIFTPAMARPERTPDSFHFFARKCYGTPKWAANFCMPGTRDVRGCCLAADVAPMPVVFGVTQMLLNLVCAR